MSHDLPKEYNSFFQETRDIYDDINRFSTLFETLGCKIEITTINELRSVLYHLYHFINNRDSANVVDVETERLKARKHLLRAYYDMFSFVSGFLVEAIQTYSTRYSLDVIARIYPRYFTHVRPELVAMVKKVAEIMSSREENKGLSKEGIKANRGTVTILLQWYSELEGVTTLLIEAQKEVDDKNQKMARKDRLDLLLKIVLPIIGVIIGFILNHYIGKK